jgi:hypothetical protein
VSGRSRVGHYQGGAVSDLGADRFIQYGSKPMI